MGGNRRRPIFSHHRSANGSAIDAPQQRDRCCADRYLVRCARDVGLRAWTSRRAQARREDEWRGGEHYDRRSRHGPDGNVVGLGQVAVSKSRSPFSRLLFRRACRRSAARQDGFFLSGGPVLHPIAVLVHAFDEISRAIDCFIRVTTDVEQSRTLRVDLVEEFPASIY